MCVCVCVCECVCVCVRSEGAYKTIEKEVSGQGNKEPYWRLAATSHS